MKEVESNEFQRFGISYVIESNAIKSETIAQRILIDLMHVVAKNEINSVYILTAFNEQWESILIPNTI